MKKVGAFEAKANLSRLLHDVESRGEEILITRHNRAIACLLPAGRMQKSGAEQAVDIVGAFREIRSGQRGSRESKKEMVNEGRKR